MFPRKSIRGFSVWPSETTFYISHHSPRHDELLPRCRGAPSDAASEDEPAKVHKPRKQPHPDRDAKPKVQRGDEPGCAILNVNSRHTKPSFVVSPSADYSRGEVGPEATRTGAQHGAPSDAASEDEPAKVHKPRKQPHPDRDAKPKVQRGDEPGCAILNVNSRHTKPSFVVSPSADYSRGEVGPEATRTGAQHDVAMFEERSRAVVAV